MLSTAADVRALVVSPDAALADAFLDVARELGVVLDVSGGQEGVPQELGREKYEALLIDFDRVGDALASLAALRANPSNRNAVVFAIATGPAKQQVALQHGSNFVLARPLDSKELRRTLYAAYDAMTQERRRYFRCTAELPVFITRADGTEIVARTSNVSTHGMSICSPVSFNPGERLGITLDLQNGSPHVLAHGTIVWDDKHGKSGINFQCVRPELQKNLNAWLDHEFQKTREGAIRELQKASAATQLDG
jgi:CheY-like chemotaxis protein